MCLYIIVFLVVGLLGWWIAIDTDGLPNFVSEDRIAYAACSETVRASVEVLGIIREKDKEPIYRVRCKAAGDNVGFWDETVELEEKVYFKYIGDGNNTISVQVEVLKFAVDDSFFEIDFTDYYYFRLRRIAYPWEEPVDPFSQEEKEIALAALLEKDYAYFGGCNGHGSSNEPAFHVGDNSNYPSN